ncbi:MAG: transposase [Blastocatellia bacterium]|nr:transposase [Blastocatellia bacterium]
MIDQLLDLDQLLWELVSPAFSAVGAPARRVDKLLRALLLLHLKNVRSENFLVHTELKNNILYRWFVRLDKDETINDSFRIGLVRLRARLAFCLSHEQWQAFLAQTVASALSQHRLLLVTTEMPSSGAHQVPAVPANGRPDIGPPQVGEVTFDLTTVKARARILDQRDRPQSKEQEQAGPQSASKKKPLPRSKGDPDAYWISKNRRGTAGPLKETTLGYETGYFATHSQGIITGVVVREATEANKTEFPNWLDQYAKDWKLGPDKLYVSADGEFHSGENLKHCEEKRYRLYVPDCEPHVAKGKLDHRYFTYVPEQDLFVCHEGAELKRIGHDKIKRRTRYRAPAEACANCPTADLCKGGKGPRKVSRSDFAEQFAHAKELAKTDQHRAARWAQHVYGEGSFAQSNCNHGLDRARFYGHERMYFQAVFTAAAMNLKKAFRFFQARRSGELTSIDPAPT